MTQKIIGAASVLLGLLNFHLQAKAYGIDSPRPCILEKSCEVENPHWNTSITKIAVTYRDEMKNTHQWTKMIHSDENIKDCDKAAAYFPYRFETCPEARE
ncbi:hypothetical protein Bealeia1_01155 [Candidatus Bealeia paramacronuclearis]|uniref:Uncharacterized protein n=1 Tax=Candidatus Bealeia paramacronuclearis TaxID=1921001 RepID=A0ABZ2C6F4_9PROT|nr:hypothetical protein [Candidatus Bealeia paramacronuclearis]